MAQCTDNGVGWSQGAGLAGPAQTSALLPLSGLPTNLPGAATDYYSKPKLVYAPDGSLGCFANHYGSQNSPPMDGYLWVAPSGGGGLFTAATLVVSQAFDPLLRPIQRWNLANTLYFGDFIGLAASNLGFFPYWSDTRGGSAQLFVSRLALNPADAYLRHFASDNGTLGAPRAGESYFDSPDLVVRLQQDGTVNFANQPVNTNNPQDLYVYGRVWNNGPNPANPISLSAALSTFGPATVWLYPHDWYEADWGAADQATHTWLGSVSTPGPLAVGQSVILGPIVIPQSAFNWASFGHPCILAKVDVDNDDSNGGAPYGCAIPAVGGVCFEQAFFWGTNNACQLNISYVTLQTGGAAFGPLRFGAGNPLSSLESLGVVFERTGALQDIPFRLRLLNPDDVIAEIPPAAMKRSEWGLADARAILRLLIRRGARLEFELHGEPLETIEGGHAGAIRVSQVTLGGKFQGGVEFAVGFTQKRP